MLAVGEDTVLDAPSGFNRCQQITVQLLGVVGIDAPVDDQVSFELDVGVPRIHIDALNTVGPRRNFGFDLCLVIDDLGVQDEVAEGGADIVFRVAVIVTLQNSAEVLDRGVVATVEFGGRRLD